MGMSKQVGGYKVGGGVKENWSEETAAVSESVALALTKTLLLNRRCHGSPKTLSRVFQLLYS